MSKESSYNVTTSVQEGKEKDEFTNSKDNMTATAKKTEPLLQDIGQIVENGGGKPTEIESYCVNCGDNDFHQPENEEGTGMCFANHLRNLVKNVPDVRFNGHLFCLMRAYKNTQGTTKLLLTRIPHWRDIVIMSFECEHCGLHNNEVQFAGMTAEKGSKYTCEITTQDDLNRQLVRSENALVKIHELELELPATNKRGMLTTVEGLLGGIISDLSADQPVRKHMDPETYEKIEVILERLRAFKNNSQEFTVSIDDAAGCRSVMWDCKDVCDLGLFCDYIENLCAPNPDPKLKIQHYKRTREMDIALGLASPDDCNDENGQVNDETAITSNTTTTTTNQPVNISSLPTSAQSGVDDDNTPEVLVFSANCSHCNAPCDTRMHVLNIPHFKEVVIMATTCDACGYRSNEVKAGGPISPKGRQITLKLEDMEDMSRDILKSETCGVTIPEVDLELYPGTLGGRFTTIEGLLQQIHDELGERVPFFSGDSVEEERRATFTTFMEKLNKVIKGQIFPVHLILDDPLANSYLQNPYAPDPDPNMQIKDYERTWEQNENLGLNDIKLDNYETEV